MKKYALSLVISVAIIAVVAMAGPIKETYDLSVAKAKIKPTSATAGDSIKVTFTVQNAGPAESPAAKANIVLVPETKEKAKSAKGITVKSIDVQPLAATTKKKMSTNVEIGENLAKGSYRMHVVIDTGKSSKDAKPGNNSAKCKKLLLIK